MERRRRACAFDSRWYQEAQELTKRHRPPQVYSSHGRTAAGPLQCTGGAPHVRREHVLAGASSSSSDRGPCHDRHVPPCPPPTHRPAPEMLVAGRAGESTEQAMERLAARFLKGAQKGTVLSPPAGHEYVSVCAALCGADARSTKLQCCAACRVVSYCGKACQKADWEEAQGGV